MSEVQQMAVRERRTHTGVLAGAGVVSHCVRLVQQA